MLKDLEREIQKKLEKEIDDELELIEQYYDCSDTAEEFSRKLKKNPKYMHRLLKKYNLQPKPWRRSDIEKMIRKAVCGKPPLCNRDDCWICSILKKEPELRPKYSKRSNLMKPS